MLSDLSRVEEGQDLLIDLQLVGNQIPEDATLVLDDFKYVMQKKSINRFDFLLEKIKQGHQFYFVAGDYRSKTYEIKFFKQPQITKVRFEVTFPKHMQRKEESFENISELDLPYGSKVTVNVKTRESDSLVFSNNTFTRVESLLDKSNASFSFFVNQALHRISLSSSNKYFLTSDTINYLISSLADEYPQIRVSEFTDSTFQTRRFFNGIIQDDYGFHSLHLQVEYENSSGNDTVLVLPQNVSMYPTSQKFFQSIDFKQFNIKKGSVVNYYFVVRDNDEPNRFKATKSSIYTYRILSKEEEKKEAEQRDSLMQERISMASNQAEELSQKIKKLQQELRGKKSLDWEDKKAMKEIINEFEELQKKLAQQAEKAEENIQKNEELLKDAEEIKEKQEALQKLMEKVLTPEMKSMMEELKQLIDKQQAKPDQLQEKLDDMKLDAEFMKEQLEREMELMKQLQFDQQLQNNIDKLKELQEKQEQLSKENLRNNDSLLKKQSELNKDFEQFRKEMDKLQKLNNDLKEPNKLENTDEQEQSIEEAMEESKNQLSKNKSRNAQKSQQQSSQKMQELSEKLENMQSDMQSSNQGEDMDNLKNILHNLVEISFNQEQLIEKVKYTSNRDPKFPEFVEEQRRIVDDLAMVEDSLRKLAMRNPSISPVVSKELKKIQVHSDQAFVDLKDMNTIGPTSSAAKQKSTSNQQYVMTSVNNLALMLSEVLQQMQQQQMQSKKGKGSCKNPKPGSGGSGKIKTMRQMQEALQKQMQKMQAEMKGNGKGNKPGGQGQQGQGGEKLSEEMAKMAAQQEAIRKMLQDYREEMLKQGQMGQAKKLGDAAREMEKTETELVNKILTSESLLRQKEIITRLLDSERAERERDQKEERESKEGKNQKKSNKNLILEYKKVYQEDLELLRTIPPELRPFYKELVDKYFKE